MTEVKDNSTGKQVTGLYFLGGNIQEKPNVLVSPKKGRRVPQGRNRRAEKAQWQIRDI